MERLTKRDSDGLVRSAIDCPHGCQYVSCSLVDGMTCQHQCEADVMCKLADYEDAEEQGLLIRLPVAEGTTVFGIIRYFFRGRNENQYEICECKFELSMLREIGKTIFLTREEAESALAEKEKAR